MQYENIIFSVKEKIATIQINRPKAYNALNQELHKELLEAFDEIEADKSIRVLVLTGNEKAFAAGADIGDMARASPNMARNVGKRPVSVNERLEGFDIPVIAAVNGLAWGGGFEIVLSCDFRVGGPKTSFKLPETSLGIIPGAGGTQRLLALVGPAKAKEMVMLGTVVKGEEAFRLGLLTRLVEDNDVLNEAYRLAGDLIAIPGMALAAAKRAINTGMLETISSGLKTEGAEFCMLFDTNDQKEGMAAFAEKRSPNYTNS